MKSISTKNTFLLFVSFLFIQISALRAQEGDFTEIFRGAPDDATKYLENYIGPGMLSFSNGMAGGWYNTAKTHKTLGLEISFSMNVANMPQSERLFTFNSNDYNLLQVEGVAAGVDTELPTLVGGPTSARLEVSKGQGYTYNGITYEYDPGNSIEPFDAPGGFDVEDVPFVGVPAPTLNLGIGLFKNTDLKIRLIPEQNFDDYSVKLFGFGIMHDVKQWIPGIRQVPLDMSLFFGTTKLNSEFAFDGSGPDWRVENGLAQFEARATTFQAVVSKKLSFFTPYLGVGFNSVNTSFVVNGDYELFTLVDQNNTANFFRYQSVSGSDDPIRLDFTGGGGMRTTLGFRLKLLILTIHMDYTIQKYNTLTFGFGFTFRENKT
ncbi:MAG: hypothetical protein RIG77_05785 [Cyclobacteriaceae bacterium]